MTGWAQWQRQRRALVDEIDTMGSLASMHRRVGRPEDVDRVKARRVELEAQLRDARAADLTGPPPDGLTREQFAGMAAKETLDEFRRAGRRASRARTVELLEHHRRLCEIADGGSA